MTKQKYKVLAASFQEHRQGDTFEAELDSDLERRALKRGQLKKMPTKKEEKADG